MTGPSRLARLLQVSCGVQLALAAAWLAWRWPAAPAQAIAGALLVPLAAPAVLGIELLVARRIARDEGSVPLPSGAELARAWMLETWHWFRTFWWRQPFRWRAVADCLTASGSGARGVVFVHGFMCNRGFWTPWMQALRERGHAFVAVNREPVFSSIDDYAAAIDAAVVRVSRATGRPPVLVCHSMGGLAARAWWRSAGSRTPVARIITIGSPHGGTWLARFSRRANGRQMQLRSAWLRQLAADEAVRPQPALTCWYSNCDNVVFPPAAAMLPRADNRFVPGQPHVALAFHPDVIRGCLDLLEAAGEETCQGESVTASTAVNG